MKTTMAKPAEVERAWLVVDATDQVLGRLAARIATVLMGKHKPTYTPHVDTGDYVVVVNVERVRVSPPLKPRERFFFSHSGYLGNEKIVPLADLFARNPEKVLRLAVRRMLPKTKLGRRMIEKLKIYRGPEHPHHAQKPQPFPETV